MLPIPVTTLASWTFIQRSLTNPASPKSVLSFFYGVDYDSSDYADKLREGSQVAKVLPLWFFGGSEYDELCEPFRDVVRFIGNRETSDIKIDDEWNVNVDGKVAQIVLCDQLARNLFRGSDESFQYEHLSLNLAKELATVALSSSDNGNNGMVKVKGDEIFPSYAYLCVLVFMHSENLSDHDLAMRLIDWGERSCSAIGFSQQRNFEIQHMEVIQRFGRYPHRNGSLKRESTEEEKMYLADIDNLPVWARSKN